MFRGSVKHDYVVLGLSAVCFHSCVSYLLVGLHSLLCLLQLTCCPGYSCVGKCGTWAWCKWYGIKGGYYPGFNWDRVNFQILEKLVKCLKKVCFHAGNWKETRITAMCQGLAYAYQTTLNATPNLLTGPVATPTPATNNVDTQTTVTGPVATTTPLTGTVATPIPVTGTAAGWKNQPVLVSTTPIHKKKQWMQKSSHLVRKETPTKKGKKEEDEAGYSKAGPSREQKEDEESS